MSTRRRRSQPYEIKGVDALFGDEPVSESSETHQILIGNVRLPKEQPRRYFDEQALQDLMESIRQHGILQPLLVRPLTGELYEVVAGERRYRAAKAVGLETVPVVVRELDDRSALQIALLENLQREDLNPVEETEGVLTLLSLELNVEQDQVVDLLNKAAHPDRNSVDNVIHSERWQAVTSIFRTVGRFTPESFRTNRLPLLNLPQDVLVYLREGKLAYTKARAIARVKDPDQRQMILQSAIAEDLSLSQIKERITAPSQSSRVPEELPLKQELDSVYKQFKKSKVWDNPAKQKRLRKLLSELRALMDEEASGN
ncbi:MAG TPA: ParB/RepB/Spo0J family partition protein [Leptolyngbyaceae cyanobacterium]